MNENDTESVIVNFVIYSGSTLCPWRLFGYTMANPVCLMVLPKSLDKQSCCRSCNYMQSFEHMN